MTQAEAYAGASLGAAWGFFLIIFVLTGIKAVGAVDATMRHTMRSAARRLPVASAHAPEVAATQGGSSVNTATQEQPTGRPATTPGHSAALEPAHQPPPSASSSDASTTTPPDGTPAENPAEESGPLRPLCESISQSAVAPLVERFNPVDDRVRSQLSKLTLVVNDADLFERFQKHPAIAALSADSKLLTLSQDSEVAERIRSQDYQSLLDNPKVAAIVSDPELAGRLKELNLDAVLDEVLSGQQGGQPR